MAHSDEEVDQYTVIDLLFVAMTVMVFVFGTVAFVADDIANADVKTGVGLDSKKCASRYGFFRVETCVGNGDIAEPMDWAVACRVLMIPALATSLVGMLVAAERFRSYFRSLIFWLTVVVMQALHLFLMTTVFFFMIAGVVVMSDDEKGVDFYPGVSVYMCLVSVFFGAMTFVLAIIQRRIPMCVPKIAFERNSISVSV